MMELALRTTIVFVLAFAIAATLRRATPATRHLLWHVTLWIVVAAPLLQPLTPRFDIPDALVRPIMTAVDSSRATDFNVGASEIQERSRADGRAQNLRAPSLKPQASSLPIARVWTIGSAIVSLWFALGWFVSCAMRSRAEPAPATIVMEARAVAREIGLKRPPVVRLTKDARGPLTVGLFRPSILLPSIAVDWSVDRRRAVLAHELAHVDRHDLRTQALAHLACALYWFNPLTWLVVRALRRERERACDDAVIATGIRPSSYAQDLLDVAQLVSHRASPSAALAMARRSELEGRLLSVLSDRRRSPVRATKWALSCAMILCTTVAFGTRIAGEVQRGDTTAQAERSTPPSWLHEAQRLEDNEPRHEHRRAVQALAHSDDEDVRERAAIELALSGDGSIIGALVAALGDRSSQVREKAALGLALRSSQEVVEPLIRALRDPDAQVREKAAAGLTLRHDARAVEALLVAAGDRDAQVREKVMMALGTSGDPRAMATLRAALQDRDSQVREKAAVGLALLRATQ